MRAVQLIQFNSTDAQTLKIQQCRKYRLKTCFLCIESSTAKILPQNLYRCKPMHLCQSFRHFMSLHRPFMQFHGIGTLSDMDSWWLGLAMRSFFGRGNEVALSAPRYPGLKQARQKKTHLATTRRAARANMAMSLLFVGSLQAEK